jgi:hypothetical protein
LNFNNHSSIFVFKGEQQLMHCNNQPEKEEKKKETGIKKKQRYYTYNSIHTFARMCP